MNFKWVDITHTKRALGICHLVQIYYDYFSLPQLLFFEWFYFLKKKMNYGNKDGDLKWKFKRLSIDIEWIFHSYKPPSWDSAKDFWLLRIEYWSQLTWLPHWHLTSAVHCHHPVPNAPVTAIQSSTCVQWEDWLLLYLLLL